MTVVKDLQELKDDGSGISVRVKAMLVNTLGFEGTKETLHDSVVVAVTGAAHADGDVVLSEEGLVVVSSVLTAAIGVME